MSFARPTSSERRLPRAVRIALFSMTLAAAHVHHAAIAAEAPAAAAQTYQLPAGPLGRTLSGVAVGAGISLSFDPALTEGMTSPALHGSYTPRAALEHLLSGTSLVLVARTDGTLTLQKRAGAPAAGPAAAAPATLAQVEVHGVTDGSPGQQRSTGATGLELSIRETPQAVSVMTRQRIEDQRLETLQDVVAQTTGITLDHSSATRETDQMYSRGFVIDTFLFDGIPTTKLVEPSGFDANIYERIEVVRGAAGLMGGTGSPAAAVNLVRKRPSRELHADFELQAGSWDRFRAQADISAPLSEDKHVRSRIVVAQQDDHSFIDRYHQDKDLFYGVVEADVTPSTLLSAGLIYQNEILDGASRRFVAYYSDGTLTDFPRSTNSAAEYSYYKRKQSLGFATLEHFFDNEWSAKLAINYAANQYDAVQSYAMRGQLDKNTGAGLSLWVTKWVSKPEQVTADAYASGPFTAFGRKHELVFGMSASRMELKGPSYPAWVLPGYDATVPNFFTWNGNSPTPGYNGKIIGSTLEREKQLAGYSSMRLRPTDDLSLILGARITNWSRDTKYVEFGAPTISDDFRKNGKLTPYAGAVYNFTPAWSGYASYTSIFSPQTYRDRNNRLLAPLEGNNAEVGIKGDLLNGLLSTSFSVFHMKQDNLAEIDSDMLLLPAGGGTYAYHTVQGATAKGYELEVSGQLQPGWHLTAGYAHSRIEDAQGQRLQTGQPLNNFKLWTSYDINKLTVGGGVNWQGEVYTNGAGPNGERFTQQSYALVALMARYRLTKELSATLNVNNLLDKKYYSSAAGGFYGDPRNVMLSLNYRFR
ncbi:outer-membrane receptor for ferric coprogen and ferric-rhodotorulic acid [Duganella sp. CF402]|uniref:TonB-dependent siderophore receptor n=1 Tax=unclassified Duganella TaxID=2636909 RepID=UPI0008AE9028|nr:MULTISPECIES: TonB-dependent receptor [unclassified Duganella]RZT10390.1 outer membrane receptor for ferric coprogen and ferric-rhodotorulic acid [Duganella sp. BK701]SEL15149.1 outer-membrane receptor for ferric coprogen and ferric-rhodotorulic acid [Duganella sp. CF402]